MPQFNLPDYYAILELPPDASQAQIKRAYHRLARLHHPDINKQAQDAHIKQLNEAYALLSNPAKRVAYDKLRNDYERAERIAETIRRRHAEQARTPRMTWPEGVAGFFLELKKGMRD